MRKTLLALTMVAAAAAPPLARADVIDFTMIGMQTPPDACSSSNFLCRNAITFSSTTGGLLTADGSATHTVQRNNFGLGTSGSVLLGAPVLGGINRIEFGNINESITLMFANPVTLVSASFNNITNGVLGTDPFGDPFDGTTEIVNIVGNWGGSINPVLSLSPVLVGLTGTQFTFNRVAGAGADFYLAGIEVAPVPEPSTWALLGLGLLGMGFMARRRTKAQA